MPTYHVTRATPHPITPQQRAVYGQLRHVTALAGGLEALANNALDAGDATPEQLEYIAELSAHLTERLTALTHAVADLPDHR